MTKLEQARENYIQAGISFKQAWEKYNQDEEHDPTSGKTVRSLWEKYKKAWDRLYRAENILLRREIKHILATRKSI